MTCEVCNVKDAERVFHNYAIHERCAPKYWVSDHRNRDRFMDRVYVWWAGK